jgi:hypothetical protein
MYYSSQYALSALVLTVAFSAESRNSDNCVNFSSDVSWTEEDFCFLSTVGTPKAPQIYGLVFYSTDNWYQPIELVRLDSFSRLPVSIRVIIGKLADTESRIGLDAAGSVFLIDEGDRHIKKINSRLTQCIAICALFELRRINLERFSNQGVLDANVLRSLIEAVDSRCLEDRDGLWPVALEEVAHGLI